MQKYLYLTQIEWQVAWVTGGDIPISLASTYLSTERSATRTPDETIIHESPVSIPSLAALGFHIADNNIGLTMVGCYGFDNTPIPTLLNANYYRDDGIILSFSNHASISTCQRLQKKCCVRINDIKRLKKILDRALGLKGRAEDCKYTSDHQRNHFLKSEADGWQDEYRMFWRSQQPRTVTLPPGMATLEFVCEA